MRTDLAPSAANVVGARSITRELPDTPALALGTRGNDLKRTTVVGRRVPSTAHIFCQHLTFSTSNVAQDMALVWPLPLLLMRTIHSCPLEHATEK